MNIVVAGNTLIDLDRVVGAEFFPEAAVVVKDNYGDPCNPKITRSPGQYDRSRILMTSALRIHLDNDLPNAVFLCGSDAVEFWSFLKERANTIVGKPE